MFIAIHIDELAYYSFYLLTVKPIVTRVLIMLHRIFYSTVTKINIFIYMLAIVIYAWKEE